LKTLIVYNGFARAFINFTKRPIMAAMRDKSNWSNKLIENGFAAIVRVHKKFLRV
jgi:hypothetical protein